MVTWNMWKKRRYHDMEEGGGMVKEKQTSKLRKILKYKNKTTKRYTPTEV